MDYFITKYALSTGIFTVSKKDFTHTASGGIYGKRGPGYVSQGFYGVDFHVDMESAIQRANEMRVKKIASLKKQIAKLEKLDFSTGAA